MKYKVTKYDVTLIIVVLIASLFFIFLSAIKFFNNTDKLVKIYVKDELYKTYVLDDKIDETIVVGNSTNYNKIVIKAGKVYISEASCHDKICQKNLPIDKAGQMIVCLPNKLIVRIESQNDDNEVDSISQ